MTEQVLTTAIAVALIALGIIYKIVARKTRRGRKSKEQFDDNN